MLLAASWSDTVWADRPTEGQITVLLFVLAKDRKAGHVPLTSPWIWTGSLSDHCYRIYMSTEYITSLLYILIVSSGMDVKLQFIL